MISSETLVIWPLNSSFETIDHRVYIHLWFQYLYSYASVYLKKQKSAIKKLVAKFMITDAIITGCYNLNHVDTSFLNVLTIATTTDHCDSTVSYYKTALISAELAALSS